MSVLHVNHRYLVKMAEESAPRAGARILEIGCGRGEVIEEGLGRGLDIHGADVFYGEEDPRDFVKGTSSLAHRIREIVDGRLPYDDGEFDLALSNQVLEHVDDLDALLLEVHRVLRDGGHFLALFPSREVVREGHCGIPAVHWFRSGSRLRYQYTLTLRRMGLGLYKSDRSPEEWTRHNLHRLDTYTFYRPRRVILQSFGKLFRTSLIEDDYITFRLRERGHHVLARLHQLPVIRPVGKELFRRLAGLVVWARRR